MSHIVGNLGNGGIHEKSISIPIPDMIILKHQGWCSIQGGEDVMSLSLQAFKHFIF